MKEFVSSSRFMKEEFPFWIGRVINHSIIEHSHDFIELVYVERGNGRHLFEGQTYTLQTGDVFIINPGETHAYLVEPGQHIEIINCLFMPSFIADTLLRELEISESMDYFYVHPFLGNDSRFNHRLNLQGLDAASVLAILDGMILELANRKAGYPVFIRLQLIELLLLLSRYYSLQQKKASISARRLNLDMTARRMYGYLERNYDKKITQESLAGLFQVSVRQLNRLFRLEFGKSMVDVLHGIRVGRAKHLLQESDEKIITIASMVGYEDPSFFSRLFFRQVGCSPGKFRTGLEARGNSADVGDKSGFE